MENVNFFNYNMVCPHRTGAQCINLDLSLNRFHRFTIRANFLLSSHTALIFCPGLIIGLVHTYLYKFSNTIIPTE